MTRDYSQFLPNQSKAQKTEHKLSTLDILGWQPFFAQQVSAEEILETPPVRIIEIHRNSLHVLGEDIDTLIPSGPDATVGDWLLYNPKLPNSSKVLERKSVFQRRAAGTAWDLQLIAANVDTAFIVSSCNQDFNIARLERYIALALEAEVTPVIILTKIDLCEDATPYIEQAQSISDLVTVVTLDARGDEPQQKLAQWCRPRQTLVFLGSSGVGKSTLTNALAGKSDIATQAVREDDDKGRHTTTTRQLHMSPQGFTILDTPGMREIQLTDAAAGVSDLFSDYQEIAHQCRFRDCKHETEPGCAIQAALETEEIDSVRVARWKKLVAEEQFNSSTLAQRKSKDKSLGKLIKQVKKNSRK